MCSDKVFQNRSSCDAKSPVSKGESRKKANAPLAGSDLLHFTENSANMSLRHRVIPAAFDETRR